MLVTKVAKDSPDIACTSHFHSVAMLQLSFFFFPVRNDDNLQINQYMQFSKMCSNLTACVKLCCSVIQTPLFSAADAFAKSNAEYGSETQTLPPGLEDLNTSPCLFLVLTVHLNC